MFKCREEFASSYVIDIRFMYKKKSALEPVTDVKPGRSKHEYCCLGLQVRIVVLEVG